jgi:hypothetical protein
MAYYYQNGENATTYLRDRKVLEKYGKDWVYGYLSDRKERKWAIDDGQLNSIFDLYKWKSSTLAAISKLISTWGWDIWQVKSVEELYDKLHKNPSLKTAFLKWVDFVAWSRIDIWEYIKSGWDAQKYLDKLEKGSKELGVKLDKKFETEFPAAMTKARAAVNADKTITDVEKAKRLKQLDSMQSLDEKQAIKDFFKFKSLSLFGSLVEWKEGGGWMMVIGNNSENEIIKCIDVEIWFFVTATGSVLPGIGIAISKTYDVTETIQIHGKGGLNVFWIYVLAWANKEVNYSEIQNASFNLFDGQTRRVGAYWNAAIGWLGGVTYGWGLYYKESKSEAIKQKWAQLEKVLDLFKNIKSTQEISNIAIPGVKAEEAKLIKTDIKNMLAGLGFDKESNTSERRQMIFDMMKNGKLNNFMQVASKIAEDSGWSWSGALLWVQFLAGFFPVPVAGLSFEKTFQTSQRDKTKDRQDFLAAERRTTADYNEVSAEMESNLLIDMKFNKERWVFEISGYDDKEGEIKNSAWKNVRIMYGKKTEWNIKIEWNKIIVWNVWEIYSISKNIKSWLQLSLVLGGWNEVMEEWSAAKFSKNNPVPWIDKWIERKEENRALETGFTTWFELFINNNIGRFNNGLWVYWSRQWRLFSEFGNFFDQWELENAQASLVRFLKLQKKSLVWVKWDAGSVDAFITKLESIKDEQERALALSEFADALFTDKNTFHLVGRPHSKRKGEHSNYDLATKPIFWKWTNRRNAFNRMASETFGSNAEMIKQLREQRVALDKGQSGWNVDHEAWKDVFAMVASYKIAKDEKWRVHSLGKRFLSIPPGTVSVADWKFVDINWGNREELYATLFENEIYKEQIRKNLINSLKSYNPEFGAKAEAAFAKDDTLFKQLLLNGEKWIMIDGKKVSLPEAKFVMFMYWRCYNESVGIKLWKLKLEIPGQTPISTPVNLMSSNSVASSTFWADSKEVNIWMAARWEKEKPAQWPASNADLWDGPAPWDGHSGGGVSQWDQ